MPCSRLLLGYAVVEMSISWRRLAPICAGSSPECDEIVGCRPASGPSIWCVGWSSSELTGAGRRVAHYTRVDCAGFRIQGLGGHRECLPETIRARRKRIYRKLELSGAGDLISKFLAQSLTMLAKGERIEPRLQASAQPEQGESAVALQ